MQTSSSSLVTLKFSARELIASTSGFIADVAPDGVSDPEGIAHMVREASAFLLVLLAADLPAIRSAFASGLALPCFCLPGRDPEDVFPEGSTPCVVIEWPRVLGSHPAGEPAPVVREAITLTLIGDEIQW